VSAVVNYSLVWFDSTLEERAQRLFLTKGKKLEDLDPAFFTKSKPGKTVGKTRYISTSNDDVSKVVIDSNLFLFLHCHGGS